jgi:hypothetical protein
MTGPVHLPRISRLTGRKVKGDEFPKIVAEWPRKNGELVRVALDEFNKRFTIDIRCWWRDANGVFKPNRNRLTLAILHLPALANGLADALRRAQALGLIDDITKDRTVAERYHRDRERHNRSPTP